jgi:hypothetical protein
MAKRRMPRIAMEQIELIIEVFDRAISDPDVVPWWFTYRYTLACGLGKAWPAAVDALSHVQAIDPSVACLEEVLPGRVMIHGALQDPLTVAEDMLLGIAREKHPVLAQAFGRNLDMLFLGAACIWLKMEDGWPDWPTGQVQLLSSTARANPLWINAIGMIGGIDEASAADHTQLGKFRDWLTRGIAPLGPSPHYATDLFKSREDFIEKVLAKRERILRSVDPSVTQERVLQEFGRGGDDPRRMREWCRKFNVEWRDLKNGTAR